METLFRKAEEEFCELLKVIIDADSCNRLLFEVEMKTFRFTVMASNLYFITHWSRYSIYKRQTPNFHYWKTYSQGKGHAGGSCWTF